MGAVTVTIKRRDFTSAARVTVADVTLSSSYATNGDTFTKAQFEVLGNIDAIVVAGNPGGYQWDPDLTNLKFKMRQGDNTNAAAAPGIEVPNTTNLSTVTGRVLVYHSNPYV